MYLTCRHTGESLDIPVDKILDAIPKQGYTSLLIGDYPETEIEKSVWIDIIEDINEINDKMIDLSDEW